MKKQHTKGELSLITMKYKTNPKEIITGIGISENHKLGVYSNVLFNTIIPETDKEYIKEHDQIKADSEHIVKCWNMHDELIKALKKAIKISDLWTFDKDITVEHEDEAKALHNMQLEFSRLIKKATESNLNPIFEQLTNPFNPNKT